MKASKTESYSHEDFQKFVGDPNTGRAIEALKRANDVFDILTPSETQHSQMLQWLLNPREGHGQGDAILKDFLIAAWKSMQKSDIIGSARSSKFFAEWTPARINMSGFHGAVVLREFSITEFLRLDILILDPQNRALIVVENKYKSIHNDRQLAAYRSAVIEMCRNGAFKGWSVALVALDKGRSIGVESDEWKHWVYLDYSWLESSAKRAEAQMQRGNHSASLVISYCQRQLDDYESPAEKHLDEMLSKLIHQHGPVLDRLVELNREALGNGKRLPQDGGQSPDNQMWLFAQHYPELIKKVGRLRRLSYLKAELAKEFPNEEFRFYANDNVIDIFNKQWDKFVEEDDKGITWWPIFVRARRVDASSAERGRKTKEGESAEVAEARDDTKRKYRVLTMYDQYHLAKQYAEGVHNALMAGYADSIDGRNINAATRRFDVAIYDEHSLVRELGKRYWKLKDILADC
ncbi:PD-(D/E)XK nuclease family protein [Burkholderia sp. AU39826]|uniref:PDDEXK-like family protein n=1 Tax=Burkholderia sp. AU39826 TaxID=2879634 RepID=UPI001CF22436|nr:PD-(D/E)XK nuclease family protein [Burkholderia sp. AU39826]MCA7970732.1 PD-(D/E)XK nuclease family protein [Burkholderia sp. AU39826]